MPLNHDLVGVESEPVERSWTSTDALLYAVGVGAGLDDPTAELAFTTENSEGVPQQVLPTFAVLLAQGAGPQARRLRPRDARARRAGVRAAPAAAAVGYGAGHLEGDRHLRQGLGRARGERVPRGGPGERRAA